MWINHLNSKNSHFSYHCGGKNSKYIVEIHNPFKSCSTIKDRVGLGFFIFSIINLILLIIFYLFFFFQFLPLNFILFDIYIKFNSYYFDCYIYIYIYIFFQLYPWSFDFYMRFDSYFFNWCFLFLFLFWNWFYFCNFILEYLICLELNIIFFALILVLWPGSQI
jgi:hypothetical protein